MTEAELRTILEKLPDDFLGRGGQILYPGIDTLQPTESGYYFLGFNPDAASPAPPNDSFPAPLSPKSTNRTPRAADSRRIKRPLADSVSI